LPNAYEKGVSAVRLTDCKRLVKGMSFWCPNRPTGGMVSTDGAATQRSDLTGVLATALRHWRATATPRVNLSCRQVSTVYRNRILRPPAWEPATGSSCAPTPMDESYYQSGYCLSQYVHLACIGKATAAAHTPRRDPKPSSGKRRGHKSSF